MKISIKMLLIILGVYLFASDISAQINQNPPKTLKEIRQEERLNEQRLKQELKGDLDSTFADLDAGKRPLTKSQREQMEKVKTIKNDIKKYTKLLGKMFVPSPEYEERFADSVKNGKMNLVRIYPDQNCDLLREEFVSVQDTERCEGIIPYAGGGSRYSFKEKSNVRSADIHFIDNKFVTGNDLIKSKSFFKQIATGVISEIGDADIENINLSSREARFLSEVNPQQTLGEFEEQNKTLREGITSSSFLYSVSAPLKLNSTYVLRSIIYRQKLKDMVKNGNIVYQKTDKLVTFSDVSVAFKVVGQEPDGSVILLWKYLK